MDAEQAVTRAGAMSNEQLAHSVEVIAYAAGTTFREAILREAAARVRQIPPTVGVDRDRE